MTLDLAKLKELAEIASPNWKVRVHGSTILALIERLESAEAALKSIAANTCCDHCQEAALVARAHMEKHK